MGRLLRELRRAPARIVTTVVALALAVAAIGVFAIPTVATSSLRASAARDGMPQIVLDTTDTGEVDVTGALGDVDEVVRAETQVETMLRTPDGRTIPLLGVELGAQQLDVVRLDRGRLPELAGEVVVSDGVAEVGSRVPVTAADGSTHVLHVVGIGTTSSRSGEAVAFADSATARRLADVGGANRVVLAVPGLDEAGLRRVADDVRVALADEGITMRALPVTIPEGTHPIEADIRQVSSLIGLLGVVAGVVALVLLASTTNTLVTERTREVAVMRALGSPGRPLRRRLRRLALTIAGVALVIGVPLGIVVANVIARMVLEEFVGLTPGVAVSVPVIVGSVAFALVGARLVAARAARRVASRPLATALRDRDGNPFGRRVTERLVARIRLGGLLERAALRNGVHRRAGSLATLAQMTVAVAALMIIASLATTVNEFNAAELEPWNWRSSTSIAGSGLDIAADAADGDPRSEVAVQTDAEAVDWDVEVIGLQPDTAMIDRGLDAGRWYSGRGEALVSTGFAERAGIDVGDTVEVTLASGPRDYEVVGLHPYRSRALLVDVEQLAADLGAPGMANRVLSFDDPPAVQLSGITETARLDDLTEDQAARDAILVVFTAIGLVVVSVAGLAVSSGLAVNVYERRHEFAALQALGARRRHVLRVVCGELLPLAVGGVAVGLAAGYVGARAIMDSFEASNAVEIGFTFATGAIPAAVAVVVVVSLLVALAVVRRATRRPLAETLRSAA